MYKQRKGQADYGNWVPAKFIYGSGAVCLVFGGFAFLLPVLSIVAVLSFLLLIYFGYARFRFSPKGGNLQALIQDLVLEHLDWDGNGKALDIGCGSGSITIKVAKKYPKAHVTGVDYWGGMWQYSKNVCEMNAEIEKVAERVDFQKASASTLPFENEDFDAVVSNLVFHEVKDMKDKREVIKEALRVVKKDGVFVFQDLFLWKIIYGEVDDLLNAMKSWGIEKVEFVDTSKSDFIPKLLKLPFMVGTLGMLYGKK